MTDTEMRMLIEMWDDAGLTKKAIARVLNWDMLRLRSAVTSLGLPEVRYCGEGDGRSDHDPTPEEIEAIKGTIVRSGRLDAKPAPVSALRHYRVNQRTFAVTAY